MLAEGQHINVNCCISYDSNRPILTSQLSHVSEVYLTLSIQFIILKRCSQPRASPKKSCDIHFLLIYCMIKCYTQSLWSWMQQLNKNFYFQLSNFTYTLVYWNVALNLELHQTNPVIFTSCSYMIKCHTQSLWSWPQQLNKNFSLLTL